MSRFVFKDRDSQTPLPIELQHGLKIKNIQTLGELDEYEEHNIAKAISWLENQDSDPTRYNFWILLHKKLLSEVWSWAGEVRKHELNNPSFYSPHNIWPGLFTLEKDLQTWVKFSSYPAKEIAARFHERLETIHPFPNGNGRFGRILTEKVCSYNKWDIPIWGYKARNDQEKRRKIYIDALIQAKQHADYTFLIEVMFS